MFSNEQIRTAMTGLVDKVGERHTSYGRYADPTTGEGACFLGALCEFMGFKVPQEGTAARVVLGEGAVSPEMGAAFGVAQCLNDAHFEWKYVLMGVDLTLKRYAELNKDGCPCGCGAVSDFTPVMDEVKRRRALDGVTAPAFSGLVTTTFASGGIITSGSGVKITGISFASAMDSMTFNITATNAAFSALEGILAGANKPVAKKDHALVA